jgi:amidase
MSGELWRSDAVQLTEAIRHGRISCREAVSASLERLNAVNSAVNAVTVVLADEALAAADEADRKIKRGKAAGPLHGVPILIKENVDQAGAATTKGVVAFRDLIAETDSPPVANWRRAGAIIIGRTNTPAFSLCWHSDEAAVPTGLSNGIPLGVQVIASRYREDLCLDAAETIEAQCGLDTPIDLQW